MNILKKIFFPFQYVLAHHKRTMLITFVSAIFIAVLIFPYGDLSDLITGMIATQSKNQVFLQFEKLGIGILPPSLKMSKVTVDTMTLPTLTVGRLYLAPSIAGLLAFRPGFSASVEDFMKGSGSLTVSTGNKVNDKDKNTARFQNIDLSLSSVDLKNLSTFLQLPMDLEGKVKADIAGQIDPSFTEQPTIEPINLNIQKFHMPSASIIGTLIPDIDLSKVILKARLVGSELIIEESTIGAPDETLNGRIKGKVGVRLTSPNGRDIVPEWGAYELKVDLTIDRAMQKTIGPFLSAFDLDKYKSVAGTGSRYSVKLSANSFYAPPTKSPLGTF